MKTAQQIGELAVEIRHIWVEERRNHELRTTGVESGWGRKLMARWDGGKLSNGTVCASIWVKIARFCVEHNVHPRLLVRAIFEAKGNGTSPNPDEAQTSRALSLYHGFLTPYQLEQRVRILQLEFDSERSCLTTEVAVQKRFGAPRPDLEVWRDSLSAPHLELSPLFRYCVAVNQGWDDIAAAYYEGASVQYNRWPDLYDKVWQQYIPATLQDETRKKMEVTDARLRAARGRY
jgi:hypothetical protein